METGRWAKGRETMAMMSSGCERCGGSLVAITFTVGGEPRTMRSCSACDHRTWHAGGAPVGLDGVLAALHNTRRVPTPTRR
jgi:hypothetical protein